MLKCKQAAHHLEGLLNTCVECPAQSFHMCDSVIVCCRSQTIACIPNRLTPMDNSNKLVALSTYTNRTDYEGIAYQSDTGGFLAIQERRIQTSGQYVPSSCLTARISLHLLAVLEKISHSLWVVNGRIASALDDKWTYVIKLSFAGVELRPVIHELEIANDLRSYSVKRRCWVAFNLSEEVTGFQDIQFHVDQKGSE